MNLLLLLPLSVWAQESGNLFSGIVTNASGEGIASVLCKALDAKDSLLAYGTTKSNGQYTLERKGKAVKITFSKMGYAAQTVPVQKGKHQYSVRLMDKPYSIGEVVVKGEPITRQNDTLTYHVESFRQKEDYSIEDVLKRMPGIEVMPSGQILYQGNSINKLNIEGMDLMGDQYNQATQNMPAEAVAAIQVMENNQPIRALEGKVRNNRATLNIKLKKNYRLRPFGDVEVGAGGTPAVWGWQPHKHTSGTKEPAFVYRRLEQSGCFVAILAKRHVELCKHLRSSSLSGSAPVFHHQPSTARFSFILSEQPVVLYRH